jgi:protein-S-isoprenylcysteine O-methyltransferase Ste14
MDNKDIVLRAGIFIAVSAAFALLSWRSLRSRRSHGFYRFFAFELLLAVVLLNAPDWFREPLSARQVVSWTILAASAGLAMEGFRLFFKIGRPARNAAEGANLRFENTTTLVTVGVYRFIRHPMYASLMGLGWGAFLKHPSGIGLGLTLGASGFLVATAVAEERENLARFGAAYAAYMKTTRRFVPFLI